MPNGLRIFLITIFFLAVAMIAWAVGPLDWWHRIPLIAGIGGLLWLYKG